MSMLIKACNAITKISDNDEINAQNCLEAIDYISNLYNFINELDQVIPVNKVQFMPSFKGKYVVERLGIAADDKENQLKFFKIKSPLFLEDKGLLYDIKVKMSNTCEKIIVVDDIMLFYLP